MTTKLAVQVAFVLFPLMAWAQQDAPVERLMQSIKGGGQQTPALSIVRETALREAATMFGARQGLVERACSMRREIEGQRAALDKRFRFSDLMMGAGVLPPVISEARDSVALDATVMRVASRVYHLDEPARIVDVAPTWRDWLLVGLPTADCKFDLPDASGISGQLRPQNAAEESFFRGVLASSYAAGSVQAKAILEDNLARLERTYHGMRRYFELYQRGMVSAPVIVSSTDVVKRDDPNTLIVGNTVIRITVPVDFVERTDAWRPLSP